MGQPGHSDKESERNYRLEDQVAQSKAEAERSSKRIGKKVVLNEVIATV